MPAERRRQARKKAVGRPRGIDDGNLFNQRNGFLDLLINNWGDAGWGFECARTPAQLVSVFSSLEVPPYQQRLVVPFQQAAMPTVTAAEVREIRRALGAVNEKLYALFESIRPHADAVRESMEALRHGRRTGHVDAIHEEHRRRLMDYGPVYAQLQDVEDQQSILQSQLTIAEASYAQYEVLAFLGTSKYTHNPRNLACAMAGLPQIGCWQSFRRCASEPSHLWPSYRYEAFELIARSLRPRTPKDEIINTLRDSILGIRPR
jgi:hypothetical protein